MTLYCFGQGLRRMDAFQKDGYVIKIMPVDAYFPPLMMSGNAHSVRLVGEIGGDRPDVVHYHNYLAWNYIYNAPLLKGRGIPLVAQYHGHPDPLLAQRGRLFWPVFRMADRYLVSTESEAARLRRMFFVDRARICVFPNVGVDSKLFRPVQPKASDPQLLYVGRIPIEPGNLWEKSPTRILWILRALRMLGESFRLTVAGDGPGMSGFTSLVDRLGLRDCVDILGFVGQRDLPPLYSRSWLTFVPMYMDDIDVNWDASLKESLACGTPVAAFNDERPHRSDLGLLLPSRPGSAALVLRDFLRNPGPMLQKAKRGPGVIAACCDWDVVIERLLHIYSLALSAVPPSE